METDGLSQADARIEALEVENAELRATLEAVRVQLSIYESLILYPTYAKQLACYPESQRPMVELAMKANFYKSRHEIKQKTIASMAAKPPDKFAGGESQQQN